MNSNGICLRSFRVKPSHIRRYPPLRHCALPHSLKYLRIPYPSIQTTIPKMPGGPLDLESQLVFYRKYHFNHKNVAIHLGCIPLILLSAIALATRTTILGKDHPYISTGSIVAWTYGLYYAILDWQLGIPSFGVLVTFAYFIRSFYLSLGPESIISQSQFTQIALGIHIVCWLAQFYGHAVHEKRAPALMDNLLQALVLAPFFVVFEVAFALGYKLDIKKNMDNKAGKLVMEMNKKEKEKKKAT